MAGRIWIPPYKPLGVSAQAVPGGGYIKVDASVAQFGGSVLGSLGRQAAEGAAGIAAAVSEHLANDNEAVVKAADVRLGEAEQTLLFDPQNGYLNTQGQTALTHAPAVLEAYTQTQNRELAQTADDDQRQMLQGLNERRLADFTTQVERHTDTERQRWYDQAGERRIAQMQADAKLHWSDDALLRRALGTTRFEVREKAERKGWDKALTEAALRQHTSRILVGAIEGAVERDPDRAQAVRTRYDQHIEAPDRVALDALLAEAQIRRRVDAASAAILNATPPDGEQPTPQWRLRQAEAITEPAVRAATIRRVLDAAAETQARARALAEQVLAKVLNDALTDPSQIPVREWVNLDVEHRQAIETRLDHNAAGTEPSKKPALVDDLATQMTRAPHEFARRDLVPEIARLSLAQWQRFRDWQGGIRRNDPATEDEIYAIKRGLQLANKMLPVDLAEDEAMNVRAGLVEEIAIRQRITGKSPDDADIADMLARHVPAKPGGVHTLEWNPRDRAEITQLRFSPPLSRPGDPQNRPEIHRLQGTKTPKDGPGRPGPDDLSPEEKRSLLDLLFELYMLPNLSTRPGPQRGQTPIPEKPIPPAMPRRSPTKPESTPTTPAANSPATKAPATRIPPGTVAGQVIGDASAGSTGRSLSPREKKAPPGPPGTHRHHEIPQDNWNSNRRDPWKFSPEAEKYFDSKTIRVMKGDHKFDTYHQEYNRLVSAAIQKHLDGPPKIDPVQMKTRDAKKLYKVVVTDNPEVQFYRNRMAESNLEFQTRYPMWKEGQ